MVFSNARGVLRHQMGFHSDAIIDLSCAAKLTPDHSASAVHGTVHSESGYQQWIWLG